MIKRLVKAIAAQQYVDRRDIQSQLDLDCNSYADLCELAALRPDIAAGLCRQLEIQLVKLGNQLANSEGEHLKFEVRMLGDWLWL